jgi:glucose/arabinose dehydrogenase
MTICEREDEKGWYMKSVLLPMVLAMAASIETAAGPIDAGRVRANAEIVADGLEHPWGLDFLPHGGAIVTERPGRLRLIGPDGKLSGPIAGVPRVATGGQGGLFDVALAQDFERSGLIFFAYAEPGRGGKGTALARARLVRDGESARLEEVRVIFRLQPKTRTSHHFGERVVPMRDGTIFVTTGDRGEAERAQDPGDSAGSVIRIRPDGTASDDNPFKEGWLPEVWSIGHRNIQGAVFDPVTGALLTAEHGARGGDEINRPEAGRNYGWPIISYGVHYSGGRIGIGTEAPGYEQPLYYWDPSIAPSGLAVYEGDMFPEWRGDLLVGSLKFELVARLDRDEAGQITGEERMFEGAFGRIRDVNVAPDGSVWLLTDEDDGKVVRISRADTP